MTPDITLIELLERIGANNGAPVFINNNELSEWPQDLVITIKSCGLITQAPPATNITCPGCEKSCTMLVNCITNQANLTSAFIICDKRNDINRVPIPIESMQQWQASGYYTAKMVSKLLDLSSPVTSTENSFWNLGVFRGSKHSSHLLLSANGKLKLLTAGHEINLEEIISFSNKAIKIDKLKIIHATNNPISGAGNVESATERKLRLQKRVSDLKFKGVKSFLKQTAEEEGISVSRLKQIINNKNDESEEDNDW